tara:strand:+ start:320 stop:637 length:318 start_codon:yes stop_codon:yes gene_type:complete
MLPVAVVVLDLLDLPMVLVVDLEVVEDTLMVLQVQEILPQPHHLKEILVVLDLQLLAHMVEVAVVVPVVLVRMAPLVMVDMVDLVFNYHQHLETLHLHLDHLVVV